MNKVNLSCAINPLSYGICGLNILLALDKIADVAYFPIGNPQVNTKKEHAEIVQKCLTNGKIYDKMAPSLRLWHQFSLESHIGKGPHIGFPIFELNKFNEIELCHLNNQDAIFVCSQWAKNVLKENNIDVPAYVVPLGVDREIFYDSPATVESNSTKLLCIGKQEVRKGHDVIPEFFGDAFEPSDNVELYVSFDNPFLTENERNEWIKLYKGSKLGDKIKFIPFQQQPQQLNVIYNSVDCLISLSRAEGWNLPLLEGLSCGKEIIATEYSGHTEFLDGEVAHTIEITDLETAYDGKWFFGQGEWAVLGDYQKEQFIEYVRKIHKKKQNGEDLTNYRGIERAKLYSWDFAAQRILEHIEKIGV